MRKIDDETLKRILHSLDQVRKRLGQHGYDKRPLDHHLQLQIAAAVTDVQRTLMLLPASKETPA